DARQGSALTRGFYGAAPAGVGTEVWGRAPSPVRAERSSAVCLWSQQFWIRCKSRHCRPTRVAAAAALSGRRGNHWRTFATRLKSLRKNSCFAFALKGRGFSRAVSLAKSMAASAADAPPSYQDDFFRSL